MSFLVRLYLADWIMPFFLPRKKNEILTPDVYLKLESLQIELIVHKRQDGFTED